MRAKYFVLSLLTIFLFSCKEDYVIGGGTDPRLNITEYTFSTDGEIIDVYSTLDFGIYFNADIPVPPIEVAPGEPKITGIDGGWYRIYYPLPSIEPNKLPYKYGAGIRIEVKPNDTGQDREIPVTSIMSGNFGCHVRFTQSK